MESTFLGAELLAEIAARAGEYDRGNHFCEADIKQLQDAGYLAAAVPHRYGGGGLSLAALMREQRRLAQAAPATALAVNMHQVWVMVAALLATDTPEAAPTWLLKDAAAGEIFAFGISEPGNDKVLFDSRSTAIPTAAGYEISGTKIFTTLSPVWSRLGVHAKTAAGKLIFGFVRREGTQPRKPEQASVGLSGGSITHPDEWNQLGMRATHSYTTHLEAVPVAAADVVTECDPFDFANPLTAAVFSSFSLLTASVYLGIADRALQLATTALQQQRERATGALPPALTAALVAAELRLRAAAAALELRAIEVESGRTAADHFLAVGAAKLEVCDMARETVATAIRLTGAKAYHADHELARLWRDVLAGMFHPTSFAALTDSVAAALGLSE